MDRDAPLEIELGGVEMGRGGATDQPHNAVKTAFSDGSDELDEGCWFNEVFCV